jgi:hypothetical protein
VTVTEGDGAAAGLLAGECARLYVSALPSSGPEVASWPARDGMVEIRKPNELGMSRSFNDGGPSGLLSLGVAIPWSRELPVAR